MHAQRQSSNASTPTAVTVGNFDGVHLGHRAIIRRARHHADTHNPERTGRVVAEVFEPHPRGVLAPGSEPQRLTDFERRAVLLKAAGADVVTQLAPTPAILALSPQAFVERVVERWNPTAWIEGEDFRFGKARRGDINTLRDLGQRHGFTVDIVPPEHAVLSDERIVPASSTLARGLIELGRVTDARRVLAEPFAVTGTVVMGDQRGRTIGVPTANVSPTCMLPADGVYAGTATTPDGVKHPAAIHVGPRATFNDHTRVLEAHIIDWHATPGTNKEDNLGYNWRTTVELCAFLRDPAPFESIDALKAQLDTDIQRARQHWHDSQITHNQTHAHAPEHATP